MNKYHRLRDTRKEGGIRMSVSIQAASAAEADAIFEERWNARVGTEPSHSSQPMPPTPPAPTLPTITNQSLREQFLSPGALEIKRRTPTFQ